MNERDMQFRIGLFVIAAGLVLTTLIIWFGESPSMFRQQLFVRVRYDEAPGVAEGISVRKSGIRIGEVVSIKFDDRPGKPEGVIVVLSIEKKYTIKAGSIARISRSLIGDVAIDMIPAGGTEPLALGDKPDNAPEINGDVTPDPAKALAAATAAFERVGGTLAAIESAAGGLASVAKKADHLDDFIGSVDQAGKDISKAARGIDRVIAENEENLRPSIANIRKFTDKMTGAFDDDSVAKFKATADRLASVSAKLDAGLNDLKPLLLDLGGPANKTTPTTNVGQAFYWINRVSGNINLLTSTLSDGKGNLNTNGTLQRLFTSPELYDNLTKATGVANEVIALARPAVKYITVFAEKIARDPGALGRGVLQR